MPFNINRRGFIKGAVAGAACFAADELLAIPTSEDNGRVPSNFSAATDTLDTDVLVVGAGASGVPAAIAAARQGAKVILLEEDLVPGGAPVDMYVAMLCGGPRVGIFREMVHRLNRGFDLSGKADPNFGDTGINGRNHWYLPSSFIAVISTMLQAEKGITFLGGVRPSHVLCDFDAGQNRDRVSGVLVTQGPERITRINAKVTIDATGTGALAALAGCDVMYGREARTVHKEPFGLEKSDDKVQRCTWMYISQRIRPDAVMDPSKLKNRGMVEDKVDHWVGHDEETAQRNAGIYLHWGATVDCRDTRDAMALARAQEQALRILEPDMAALREMGFAVHLAPKLGVRECRRVRGEHVLTVTEMKSGKYADDVIALSDYGLDPWGMTLTKEQIACPRFGIPYRCLVPQGREGLLIAGKSISGTHLAASAYRVQPIVAGIGQASGTAAAMACQLNVGVRDIPIPMLQENLRREGVI